MTMLPTTFLASWRLGGSIGLFLLLFPLSTQAHQILFYYNSRGVNGIVSQCVTILRDTGNQVTVIDVNGKQRDPGRDNWDAYEQVWDMRYVEGDQEKCGSGSPASADYFDDHWREKAVRYLNHCGNLFIGGEHYQMANRDEGVYRFLRDVHAVKEGYDPCPPSARGNSTTNDEDFYPVKNGLGPTTFFGAYVGGIPTALLTGTSFVDTRKDWQDGDRVRRSIVSGWRGNQLGGAIRAPLQCRGKLFMVWDATLWTLWDPDVQGEIRAPHPWDESSWNPPNAEGNEERERAREIQIGQSVTRKFFPSVAKWLGGEACPCGPETEMGFGVDQGISTLRREKTPVVPALPTKVFSPTPFVPRSQVSFSKAQASGLGAPQTLQFDTVPINLYIRFRDGAGEYRLDLWNAQGRHIRQVYGAKVTTQQDDWASWDGLDELGGRMPPGLYTAVLSKEGRVLRRVTLFWTLSPRKENGN